MLLRHWPRFWLTGCLLLSACRQLPVAPPSSVAKADSRPAKVTPTPGRQWCFQKDGVTFDSGFPRARLNECKASGAGEFTLTIRPENRPINNSAWFAFKVSAAQTRQILVRLQFEGGTLRYRPKISTDGRHWVTLPAEAFEGGPQRNQRVLRLEVGPEPLWVAAQELVSRDELDGWSRTLERLPFVTRKEIGRSLLQQPLYQLDIGGGVQKTNHVIILGRQHPPETTGSLALMRFVEEIVGDSDLARSFRNEFHVLLVPLVNPDGVDQGHWRHNMNGVDLNRDWGKFAQPETRAVRDQILALRDQGRVFLHLDFHSTFHDVFYTQPDDAPSSPAGFTKRWIEGIQARFPDYKVSRSSSLTPTSTTSHNWVHQRLGVPAITYEIGDNTDRALLQQIATGAAQEMMTLLLELKK
jgi:cytosolic carboxypeptidase protein 6